MKNQITEILSDFALPGYPDSVYVVDVNNLTELIDRIKEAEIPKAGSSLYYIQDSRTNCGNNMMFWRKGCQGYTQCIADAEVFTADEVIRQMISRRSDVPWRKDYIDGIASLSVDTQRADIRAANMLPPSQCNDLPESLRDQA